MHKDIDPCAHENAVQKKYLGSSEKYFHCPDCGDNLEGEETPAKKMLLAAACEAEDMFPYFELEKDCV